MARLTACIAVLALAACAATQPVPEPARLGQVQIGPDTYPISAASAASPVWQVMVNGHPVTCSKPRQEACYWSVRHYLTAQDLLDDLPS